MHEEDDGNRGCRLSRTLHVRGASRHDQVHLEPNQVRRELREPSVVVLNPTGFDPNVSALDPAKLPQAELEVCHIRASDGSEADSPKIPIRYTFPACASAESGARARTTASPSRRIGTSRRMAGGESSRTRRRAPASAARGRRGHEPRDIPDLTHNHS